MLRFRVFDPTGATLLGEIANPVDGDFLDEMNAPGIGRIAVPIGSDDAALLQRDNLVRVYYEDEARFAWVIETLDRDIVDLQNNELLQASGRGVLSWLEDAIVFPQAGLTELASTERPFSFASASGDWETSASFTTPVGVTWTSDTGSRAGNPQGWPDRSAQWIWSTSPTTANVRRGTINWFRSEFTTTAMQQARVWATADSQFELWLDGTLILSSSQFSTDYQAWQQFTSVNVRIPAGDHTFAALVRSGQPWARSDIPTTAVSDTLEALQHGLVDGTAVQVIALSAPNGLTVGTTYYVRDAATDSFRLATSPGGSAVDITADATVDLETVEFGTAGFLMSAATLDASAIPTTVIVRSNTTDWEVSAVEPEWRPALILETLVEEAAARGVYRMGALGTTTFSASLDSDGDPWTSATSTNVRVGSTLIDVHNALIEQDVDFRVDPATLQLGAYDALGEDKSANVYLHAGNSFVSLGTSVERKVKTVAVIRTPSGWATSAVDGERRETYLEAGGATSANTARDLAGKVLSRSGVTLESANAVTIVARPGSTPYVDFSIGDVISIPKPDGSDGWERARVLSLAGKYDGTHTNWSCELGVLNGEAGMRRPPRLWEQQISSRLRAISPGADLGAVVTQPVPPPSTTPGPSDPREGDIISLNVPSTPVLQNATQGLVVGWDGKDSSGGTYPTQAFVLIHVSTTSGFTPSAATVKGVLYAQGIFTIGGLTPGVIHYVKLVGGTDRGIRSAASTQASITVTSVVNDIPAGGISSSLVSFDARDLGGIQQFVGPSTPTGGTYFAGDTWVNTTNLTYNVYNGSIWVQQQWGTAAISAGAITAGQIAAGAIIADKIEANALTGKTLRTAATGKRIEISATGANNGDIDFYNSSGVKRGSIAATADYIAVSAPNGMIVDGDLFGNLNTGLNWNGGAGFGTTNGLQFGLRVDNADGSVYSFGIDGATTANAANVRVGANAQLLKETSTERVKTGIIALTNAELVGVTPGKISEDAASADPYDVLAIAPVEFQSLAPADGDQRLLGFIAENVSAVFPWAAEWDEDGLPSSVQDRPILAALLAVVRDQAGIIGELRSRIEALEA
jgi:hypothetical protein